MPIPKKILKFLEKSKIKYELIKHRTVYTAFDKAMTLKIPEKIIGKTLILKKDRDLILVLIPANKNLDIQKFKKVAKSKKIDFVSEKIIKEKFKGVKVGAIPPFGNLWSFPTFVDRSLFNQPKIIINSGIYDFSIKISPKVFKKLIPDLVIGNFSKARK